ncbi:hypothetical protein HHK36_000831 [Tetracentron sinense]|uniref:Uncharacterized protein n=1 Tax=Tetracentron sinense TaxID=13715 RepID=A0A834ZRR1_TETSI|nr:hypothetical protein HHK36_000831 [Tetracentron sinense]
MSKESRPWRPFTANCCSIEDQTAFGNFSRCRPSRSDFSKNIAPLPSFRRLSFSDLSTSSSIRINEDLAHSFGSDLHVFQLSELRAITQNFSNNFLLGEGGFGTVHKGYVDESLRQELKAQAVAVKLLDIEGLQGHREWLGAREVAYLALQCVSSHPKDRPRMPDIIEALEALQYLRDMAVTCGQWPATPKSSRNGVSTKGRRESRAGANLKPSPIAPIRKS